MNNLVCSFSSMKYVIIFIALWFVGCSSVGPQNFRLKTNENTTSLGDTVFFEIVNPKNYSINQLTYAVNGKIVPEDYLVLSDLGKHLLSASFFSGDTKITLEQHIDVFADKAPLIYTYELVNTYPHDANAYTQGLEFYKGVLYESTGQYGASTIRKVDFTTGEVLNELKLDASYFGEGLSFYNEQLIQLTWKENIGFVYDPKDFTLLRSFQYNKSKEGWGLCSDENGFYKTDGTEKLWTLHPETFEELRSVDILTNNKYISKVNEMEYVDGLIFANTYQFNKEVVVMIDPQTGVVKGVVDFSGLKEKVTKHSRLDVFNGIAYHPERKTFFVTGKYWDKLFEVKIVNKNKS